MYTHMASTFFNLSWNGKQKHTQKNHFAFPERQSGLCWSLGQSIHHMWLCRAGQEPNTSTCKCQQGQLIAMRFNRRQGGPRWLTLLLVIYSCCRPAQCVDVNVKSRARASVRGGRGEDLYFYRFTAESCVLQVSTGWIQTNIWRVLAVYRTFDCFSDNVHVLNPIKTFTVM